MFKLIIHNADLGSEICLEHICFYSVDDFKVSNEDLVCQFVKWLIRIIVVMETNFSFYFSKVYAKTEITSTTKN